MTTNADMRWRFPSGLTVVLVLAGLVGLFCSRDATNRAPCPQDETWWFPATGHTVGRPFLCAFLEAGGADELGRPVTEPFQQEGRTVQCFEYACLEDHWDAPDGPQTKLSQLGERLGRRQPAITATHVPSRLSSRVRYFPASGHAVSGDFLAHYDAGGGVRVLGMPIAEPAVANGCLVQDFQLARLVWHPWEAGTKAVTRERIGTVYVGRRYPHLLASVPRPPDAVRVP